MCHQRYNRTERTDENCPQARTVRRNDVDQAVERAVLDRLSELRDLLARPPADAPAEPDFDKARAEIAARRKRLVSAFASGALTAEDIAGHVAGLDRELAAVNAEAAKHSARATTDTRAGRAAALARVDVIAADWSALTLDERREVIALLAVRVVLSADGVPVVTWADASALAATVATETAPTAPASKRRRTGSSEGARSGRSAA